MASNRNRSNTASMLHSIAEQFGVDPELVGAIRKEHKLRSRKDIEHAVQEHIANLAKADEPTPVDSDATPPAPKKEKKASLTLSQRRALLRLLDADPDGLSPTTGFKALPYEHLTEVGYAERESVEDVVWYRLTQSGRTRAESINPGYRVWSAGETVAGDESRPEAGTKRAEKAAAEPTPVEDEDEPNDVGPEMPIADLVEVAS